MAAFMRRGRAGFCLPSRFSKASKRHGSGIYYVLLPEMPPDTKDSNPLLRVSDQPSFSDIQSGHCVTGCAKLAINYETQLGKHIETLQDPTVERTFENVFHPLEEVSVPMNYAWRTARHLSTVRQTTGFTQAFTRIHRQIEKAKSERWASETLHYAIKEVGEDAGNLTEAQRRLVDIYLLEGRLNGIELNGSEKTTFLETLKRLHSEKINYRMKVRASETLFDHRTENFNVVQNLPRNIVSAIAEDRHRPERGPWKITLQRPVYESILEFCDDRTMRWNVWQAYNGRASVKFSSDHMTNHKTIEEIRDLRKHIAEMLGYKNFAEMSMETKMAGTVENVLNMIETFKCSFKSQAEEEIEGLQDFASAHGLGDKLQMWDVAYWKRRQGQQLFKLDEAEIAQYFTLDKVVPQLFALCSQLFGISFKEATGDVDTWHSDVRYFKVYDHTGENISSFYFDPFMRVPEKSLETSMEMGRERSEMYQTKPFSYLVMNLPKPISQDSPVVMTFSDVQSLFHEFGHGLQQMLSRVPYSELSGQRNIEWDALHVCAKLFERFLTVPRVLQNISGHYQTGEPIPSELVDKLLQSQKLLCGYDMMRQLFLSAFDMEMHISQTHWTEVQERTWKEFMPLPLSKDDHHPCNFTHIFSGPFSAGYYGFTWVEMIAADLFAAFEEAGLEESENLQAVGARFRDTFLALGGGLPSSEVFRRFRGRDPSLDALQIYYGVK